MTTQQEEAAEQGVVKKKKEKAPPENLVIPPNKPKLTKAERRALQEQQRAAKAGGSGGGVVASKPNTSKVAEDVAAVPVRPQQQQQQQQQPHQSSSRQVNPETTPANAAATATAAHNKPAEVASSPAMKEKSDGTVGGGGRNKNSTVAHIFSHLAPYQNPAFLFDTGAVLKQRSSSNPVATTTTTSGAAVVVLHPAVIRLGYQYAVGAIRGGNARCRAMLECYITVLRDFCSVPFSSSSTAANANNNTNNNNKSVDLRYVVDHTILKPAFTYWTSECRPHSVSMGNAFTFLKSQVNSLDRDLSWETMLETLAEKVSDYIRERIEYAVSAIAEIACTKLLHDRGEVVLTYGHSEAVQAVLLLAADLGKQFRVIVVDSEPLREGRLLLQTLLDHHIDCCYILLHAITYVLPTVTKVLLGAVSLQSDGSVTARAGTAVTALSAHARCNIPVLVCAETHNFSNRVVQLESITDNELGGGGGGGSSAGASGNTTRDFGNGDGVKRLHLLYDLTPAAYVSGIVTEHGIVPPSSVAVLLREMNQPQDAKR